jgi:hypothetical protein
VLSEWGYDLIDQTTVRQLAAFTSASLSYVQGTFPAQQ